MPLAPTIAPLAQFGSREPHTRMRGLFAALMAWRNWRATTLRLLAPLFFLLLALLIDKALQANQSRSEIFADVRTPTPEAITSIPSCHEDMYIGNKACIEILYSPDNAVTRVRRRRGGSAPPCTPAMHP